MEQPDSGPGRLYGLLAAVLLGLALGWSAPSVHAGSRSSEWGTRITVHGWSPDGTCVAYTRTRVTPGEDGPERERRGVHWRVKGGQFAESGPTFGADLARYASRHDYHLEPLERRRSGERDFLFSGPEGVYELTVEVGKRLVWELRFDDRTLVRQAFDAVYVDVDAMLYPSADRRQAIVVMHLDRGFMVDGAVYPISLPPRVRERHREVREALRSLSRKGAASAPRVDEPSP